MPDLSEVDDFLPLISRRRKPPVQEKAELVQPGRSEAESVGVTIKTRPFTRFTEEFTLSQPHENVQYFPSSRRLNFSLEKKEKEAFSPDTARLEREKSVDLVKALYYGYSATTSLLPSKEDSSSGYLPPGMGGGVNIKSYRIESWAEAVSELVIANWVIPFSLEIKGKRLIKVSVTVARDGKITSLKIINSSNLEWLDQTALKAINLSAPFPDLPHTFPFENLTIYIVFQTNE